MNAESEAALDETIAGCANEIEAAEVTANTLRAAAKQARDRLEGGRASAKALAEAQAAAAALSALDARAEIVSTQRAEHAQANTPQPSMMCSAIGRCDSKDSADGTSSHHRDRLCRGAARQYSGAARGEQAKEAEREAARPTSRR